MSQVTARKTGPKIDMRQYGMLIALIVIIVFFNFLTQGRLLKPMNVSNLINQNAYVIILAIGMLLCILTGGNIDLSCGSVVALVGACAATFIITWGWNVYLSIFLCLMIGIAIGAWQGFWIAYVGIPPFICTPMVSPSRLSRSLIRGCPPAFCRMSPRASS